MATGGGIYNNNGVVTFVRSTISGNQAGFAGASYNLGGLVLRSTTVTRNTSASIGGYVNNS